MIMDCQLLLQQLLADIGQGLHKAGANQDRELDPGEEDYVADVLVAASGVEPLDDLVDQAPGQPDLQDRHNALQQVGHRQGGGEEAAGRPDQPHDPDDAPPRLPGAASDSAGIKPETKAGGWTGPASRKAGNTTGTRPGGRGSDRARATKTAGAARKMTVRSTVTGRVRHRLVLQLLGRKRTSRRLFTQPFIDTRGFGVLQLHIWAGQWTR
jgi:hypothetical protein